MVGPRRVTAILSARRYGEPRRQLINVHYFAAAGSLYGREAETAGMPPTGASYTAYNGAAYPYFFKDTNKNGVVDASETTAMKFDSKTLRASFNYQYSQKEPGAWAHNNKYIVQILYDSIDDLDGDLTGLIRP